MRVSRVFYLLRASIVSQFANTLPARRHDFWRFHLPQPKSTVNWYTFHSTSITDNFQYSNINQRLRYEIQSWHISNTRHWDILDPRTRILISISIDPKYSNNDIYWFRVSQVAVNYFLIPTLRRFETDWRRYAQLGDGINLMTEGRPIANFMSNIDSPDVATDCLESAKHSRYLQMRKYEKIDKRYTWLEEILPHNWPHIPRR